MKSLSNAVQGVVGRQSLMIQKNSPKMLFVGGVVGMVGSTVLACRATLKLEEVLETTQKDLKVSKRVQVDHPEKYSESELKKDTAIIYVRSVAKVGALYAPAIVLGGASITMLTKSHNLLNERNAALTAAYVALDKGFNEYRQRVVDKYGEDEDRLLRYESEVVEIEEKGKKKKKQVRVGPGGASIYARFFDEYSASWSKDPDVNRLFIHCQQNLANDLLHARGHLFLNEVYGMLGLPHTNAGSIVGWVMGPESDGYVDFGVFVSDGGDRIRDFVNGREGSVLLDFNVDGLIWDKIENPGEDLSWQLGQK